MAESLAEAEDKDSCRPLLEDDPFSARRKHPRKGRVPPIQFMPTSDSEPIDLDPGKDEMDDLYGPFLYDETGIEAEGTTKPM
jgi:hypothetical protein